MVVVNGFRTSATFENVLKLHSTAVLPMKSQQTKQFNCFLQSSTTYENLVIVFTSNSQRFKLYKGPRNVRHFGNLNIYYIEMVNILLLCTSLTNLRILVKDRPDELF